MIMATTRTLLGAKTGIAYFASCVDQWSLRQALVAIGCLTT